MIDQRKFEGIGYHHFDLDGDYLLVEMWTERPADLTGQSLPLRKLLPLALRCSELHRPGEGYPEYRTPQKFKFRIIVEIDEPSRPAV
jgi:hypothetical protein